MSCPAYTKTMHHLNLHQPVVILVIDTALTSSARDMGTCQAGYRNQQSNKLVAKVEAEVDTVCEGVPRCFWNRDEGQSHNAEYRDN